MVDSSPSMILKRIGDEEFEIKAEIGKGAVWRVYQAKSNKNGRFVALKETQINFYRNEADLLRSIDHRNVLKLIGDWKDERLRYLITDLCSTDLAAFLQRLNGRLPSDCLRVAAKHLALGYFHLYQNKILHKNLSSKNVLVRLVGRRATLIISGFNCAMVATADTNTKPSPITGRCQYMAPEIGGLFVKGQRFAVYSYRSDIWALGVLLYEISVGAYPYDSRRLMEVFQEPTADTRPFWPPKLLQSEASETFVPDAYRRLVSEILRRRPEDRPNPDELLLHECLHGIDDGAPMLLEELGELRELDLSYADDQHRSIVRVGQYEFDECDKNASLGAGSFGSVWRARRINDGQQVALKRVLQQDVDLAEVETMQTVTHPNLLRLVDVHQRYPYFYIVTELCAYDLESFLTQCYDGKFRHEAEARILSRHLSCGYMAMRSADILHRDIKPGNVLVSVSESGATFKLADFGCSKKLTTNEYAQTVLGTPWYMAPELGACLYLKIETARYDHRADVWSMGLIVFRSLIGRLPLDEADLLRLFYDVGVGLTTVDEYDRQMATEMDHHGLGHLTKDLISRALRIDYNQRLTAAEFFQHSLHNRLLSSSRLEMRA